RQIHSASSALYYRETTPLYKSHHRSLCTDSHPDASYNREFHQNGKDRPLLFPSFSASHSITLHRFTAGCELDSDGGGFMGLYTVHHMGMEVRHIRRTAVAALGNHFASFDRISHLNKTRSVSEMSRQRILTISMFHDEWIRCRRLQGEHATFDL